MEKQKEKKLQINFVIEESKVELIDYYAEKVDRSRSQFLRGLILNGLDDARIMNAVGIFDLVKLVRGGRQMKLLATEVNT